MAEQLYTIIGTMVAHPTPDPEKERKERKPDKHRRPMACLIHDQSSCKTRSLSEIPAIQWVRSLHHNIVTAYNGWRKQCYSIQPIVPEGVQHYVPKYKRPFGLNITIETIIIFSETEWYARRLFIAHGIGHRVARVCGGYPRDKSTSRDKPKTSALNY